jgi:hypothetical protein
MDPVTAMFGLKLLNALASAGAKRLKTAALGGTQQRALEGAVQQSSEAVAARHAELAAISAEIDLMSDDAVVAEVVAAATGERAADWTAAGQHWYELYGTESPTGLPALLQDLADELSRRLRGDPDLQMVFLVSATGLLVERTAEIGDKVDSLREGIAAQVDPVRAVRARGDEIERDLGLVSNIFGQVGAEMSRGLLREIDLDVSLTQAGTSFRIKPKAGADVTVTLTMKAPNTPEGRARMESLRTAMEHGEPVDIPDAQVAFEAGGVPFPFPTPVRASARAATARHHAVLEFQARGLPAERFFVDLDIANVGGKLRGESAPDTTSLLRVELEDLGADAAKFRFTGNADVATVRNQLKMARLGRHLKRGGKLSLWFVEMDFVRTTSFPANPAYDLSDRDHEIMKLFEEIQRMVGAEVGQVDELTPADVADLRMAKRLLDTGWATLPGRGGTFTTTTGDDIRLNVGARSVKRGRLQLRTVEPNRALHLSRHPLLLGPIATTFTVFWPPTSVTKRADGSFLSEMEIDPSRPIRLERLPADQLPQISETAAAKLDESTTLTPT